jgi:hypothetical protein
MLEEGTIDIIAEGPRDGSRRIGELADSCLVARRIAVRIA